PKPIGCKHVYRCRVREAIINIIPSAWLKVGHQATSLIPQIWSSPWIFRCKFSALRGIFPLCFGGQPETWHIIFRPVVGIHVIALPLTVLLGLIPTHTNYRIIIKCRVLEIILHQGISIMVGKTV